MKSIHLTEVSNYQEIAIFIKDKMHHYGITKKELMEGTGLSATSINNVLEKSSEDHDYLFSSLLKILQFLKITIFIGSNDEDADNVYSLF